MSPQQPVHEICGKKYSRIQLLKLAGVHGIHPRLHFSDRIEIDVDHIGPGDPDEGALLTIKSISIMTLQVIIYPNQKIVKNEFILSTNSKSKIAYDWVDKQVAYTKKYNYQRIECFAERDDEYYIQGKDQIFPRPIIGYLIWMKLGYLMNPEAKEELESFLRKNDRELNKDIREVVVEDYEFWKDYGYSWKGYFDLRPGSESEKVLRAYFLSHRN